MTETPFTLSITTALCATSSLENVSVHAWIEIREEKDQPPPSSNDGTDPINGTMPLDTDQSSWQLGTIIGGHREGSSELASCSWALPGL